MFLMMLAAAACSQGPRVAVIAQDGNCEQEALVRMISDAGYDCSPVGMDADFSEYDVVWYHRPDTSCISAEETALGKELVPYVENGGSLVLSLDAVRLSNAWGLEPNPVDVWSQEAVDEGFGRQVGYHSHRAHPLFDGLFGGAYVWHGHEDNVNRVLGYNGDDLPENARIIATLWEYIFYQPSQKVVWEQKLGKGSILSIGSLLYYSRPNHHEAILRRFTENVVKFMGGVKSGTPEGYWDYSPVEVITESAPLMKRARAPKPERWAPATGDSLAFEGNRNEVTIPSRRALVVCEEQGGIKEIWTHPVMSLRDYIPTAVLSDGTEFRLDRATSKVVLRFNCLEREYRAGDVTIREVIVPSVSGPAVVAHYEWDGDLTCLKVEFSSNMRYMWPYAEDALGSLYCGWSESKGCYSIRDVNSEFVSLVGSNLPGRLLYEGRDRDLLQVRAGVEFMTGGADACDVVMCAGNEGLAKAEKDYASALMDPESVLAESSEYYEDYLASVAAIETPDKDFNEGYRWAVVSAIQFLAETPGLGTGLMAGYSSSQRGWGGGHRVSGRPGYAWYFGRDSELSSLAFLSMGDFDTVRKAIELLTDYQNVNGKVFHELVTSGSDHFDASDSTPLLVVLMAEYVRATGDIDFAMAHMQNVFSAIGYSRSTDTDGDNLIEIQHVGHGWLEGGDYFKLGTEYYLSGIWARALKDGAWLAELAGEKEKAEDFKREYGIVRAELEKFWNPKGYYNYGKDENGQYSTAHLALPSVPVWLGMADPERAYIMVKKYAGPDFSTDWGVRQTNDPRPEEGVGAYDESNIWPMFTGSVSLAEYAVGRYNQGFEHMMANLLCFRSASHGRVPEVFRGNSYRSGGITRHQCWSETAVTGPAIQGMLGFHADALNNSASLAPRLPFDWDSVKVSNLAVGKTRIGMEMEKSESRVVYKVTASKPLDLDFAPAFPPATVIESVKVDGKPAEFSVDVIDEYVVLHTALQVAREAEVEIDFSAGVTALPVYFMPEDDSKTSGIRVISQKAAPGGLSVEVAGPEGTQFLLPVYAGGERRTVNVCFGPSPVETIIVDANI